MSFYMPIEQVENVEEREAEINLENEIDRDNLHDLIQKVANKFTYISSVNPRCTEVLQILDITESNSWKSFQNKHLDLLLEYMDPSPNKQQDTPAIEQEPDKSLTWRKERIEKALINIRKKIKGAEEKKTEQNKEKERVRNEFIRAKSRYLTQIKRARLSKAAKEECDELRETMQVLIDEQNELSTTDYTAELLELRHEEIRLNSEMNFIKRAEVGNFPFYSNTGDPQWDAQRYNSAAEDAAFEYNMCLEREIKALEDLAQARYQPDCTENLQSEFAADKEPFAMRRLREIRDRMSFIQDQFACYEHGYMINEELYMAENEGKSPLYRRKDRPQRWLTLEERVALMQAKREGYTHLSDDSLFVMP